MQSSNPRGTQFQRQPLAAKRAEVRLRARLSAQHLGRKAHFAQEYTQREMAQILRQRAQLAKREFARLARETPLSPFLEIGAEYGQASLVLVNEFEAHGVASDIAAAPLQALPHSAHTLGYSKLPRLVVLDAESIPFPNASFPFVFCSQTLHHFPHPRSVTSEVERVLMPGGVFFMADEPVGQRANLGLWRRPTKLRWWEKLLKASLILPFVSRIGKTEVDHGVIEDHPTLAQWRDALSLFQKVKTTITPVPFGPLGSLEMTSPLNRLFLFFLGGGIQAVASKTGVLARHKPRPFPQLACVSCWVGGGMRRDRPRLTATPTGLTCPNCHARYPQVGGIPYILEKRIRLRLYPKLRGQ